MKAFGDLVVSIVAVAATVGLGGLIHPGSSFVSLAMVAIGIQCVFYIPAMVLKTEKFYDAVGGSTFLVLAWLAWYWREPAPWAPIQGFVLAAQTVWALRLGVYLFLRVHQVGVDARFDAIKTSWTAFLVAWTVQGLWTFVVSLPVLVLLLKKGEIGTSPWSIAGAFIWVVGWGIEVLADYQKSSFRKNPENAGKWIHSGLWARAQHPNYFGEIALWSGLVIAGMPFYEGWEWTAVLSPVVTASLLLGVSGVPMVRAQNARKWGSDEEYLRYLREVPLLVPGPRKFQRRA